jgi:flagellar basal-body rod protein FlgC
MTSVPPITSQGPFSQAMQTAASGMRAQSIRLRIVSENLANANSTAKTPGGSPYQRKTVTFSEALDKATGASVVEADKIGVDQSPFRTEYNPGHPAADANGFVSLPNVTELVEVADMREAERSYEANLAVLGQARSMISKTLDILKA